MPSELPPCDLAHLFDVAAGLDAMGLGPEFRCRLWRGLAAMHEGTVDPGGMLPAEVRVTMAVGTLAYATLCARRVTP